MSWINDAAKELASHFTFGNGPDDYVTDEQRTNVANNYAAIIAKHAPPPAPPSLLQCVDCRNTESPAGAMARHFNHGRCLHCGGYFKVVRA